MTKKMKFNKPFHIRLTPNYMIKEPMNYLELEEYNERVNRLGGINVFHDDLENNEDLLRSGGGMDWQLYNEPQSHKPIVNVNLMRIWATQIVTQMINEKAYVNEAHSEPKFHIDDTDKEVVFDVIKKMTEVLHHELEKSGESMVLNKKTKFNFK